MSTLIHDALQSRIPHQARRYSTSTGSRHEFNCALCRETRKRARIYLNGDGSCGYQCFNCNHNIRQNPERLTHKMEAVLIALGMGEREMKLLKHDIWREQKRERYPEVKPKPPKQPLPAGARLIGDWIAEGHSEPNFDDLIADLDDMRPALRDGYYWTPEAGTTGDMNRRYIWVIGDPALPDAWIAHTIDNDDESVDTVVGDPDAWFHAIEDDSEEEE